MDQNNGYELSWDATIEKDSPEYILLPDGEYDFVVDHFERSRHEGSEKLPPCPKATLFLKFTTPEGETTIRKDLFLHSKCEGMLCAFFTSIGQRKHGQSVMMNWNAVNGARGRAKVGRRTFNGNTYNEIKRFLEPKEPPVYQQPSAYPQQPAYQQQPTYQQPAAPARGYTPGKF